MRNSFGHAPCPLETLREHRFFLITCGGGGYTAEGVGRMPLDEVFRETARLSKKLDAENKARKAAEQKIAAQSRRRR